ncbi:MAG: hypothetical protein D8M58_00590 [Calditrichaeota bacterium]|nr:MAG: hypothetical protein DWQ03_06490 [Calditrichota bacterium]MBL1203867.1 hypothetical protein [Calditrichota bacterium]NOG43699.1 AgmX/PglI C-terminal domain-containing protein [Calditrichota bacterium]
MVKNDFNVKYAKPSLLKRTFSDILFFRILAFSLILTLLTIIILANIQFENVDEQIKKQYKEYVLSLTPEPILKKEVEKQKNIFSTKTSSSGPSERFAFKDTTSAITPQPTIRIADIEIEELSHDGEADGDITIERPVTRQQRGEVKLEMDGLMTNKLFEYEIERNANLYIKEPVSESAEKEKFGYRDQEEVYRVIETKSVNIESCYNKAARYGMVKSGYVKVQFKITSDGYILPQSIRIIESNLRNKSVEQCIKKTIRRLRGFEKLDESKGTARIRHKFVFN